MPVYVSRKPRRLQEHSRSIASKTMTISASSTEECPQVKPLTNQEMRES